MERRSFLGRSVATLRTHPGEQDGAAASLGRGGAGGAEWPPALGSPVLRGPRCPLGSLACGTFCRLTCLLASR